MENTEALDGVPASDIPADQFFTQFEDEPKETPPADEPTGPTEEEIAEARKMGWRPKEEYTGNPANWVDAKEYAERGSPSRLRERLDKTEAEAERTKAEFQRFRQEQIKVAAELQKEAYDRAQREYEARMKELDRKAREGFETGSWDDLQAAEREKQQLELQRLQRQTPPPDSPMLQQAKELEDRFVQEHSSWYNVDPERTKATDALIRGMAFDIVEHKKAAGQPPTILPQEYEQILNRVAAVIAPKKDAPKAPAPAVAPGRNAAPPASSPSRFSSLPAEDQASFKAFQRHGLYPNTGNIDKDAAEFVKDYYATNSKNR